jgi:tRNA A-37 threonylcarbamoyl transferase component Bud32
VTTEPEPGHIITLEQPAPLSDLIGKRWVTQSRFVRLIGCGGMGEVWAAASDDIRDHMVAVKVIALEHAHRPDALARFFGEAQAASILRDPNVIRILGTGRLDDGRPVLLMEHIEGPSIQAMVEEQGPLPIDTIGQLMIQAASALRATHARGIIHRDIKPGNLLVSRYGGRTTHLTVVDFGIAKLVDPELAGKIRTRTKMFMGTPGFLAPEQAHGRAIDAKVDTYALGVVLYFMLTGRLPYQGDSALEILSLQAKGAPFPDPIELRPETPPEWDELVRDCVQLDPVRRPTAVEFGRRIAGALSGGKTLLNALAPEIAVHRGKSSVFAATLSIDVPTALTQLSAQYDVPRLAAQKRERIVRIGLGAAGVLIGGLLTLIALWLSSPGKRECPTPQHGAALDPGATRTTPPPVREVTGQSPGSASDAARVPPTEPPHQTRATTSRAPGPESSRPPGAAPSRPPAAALPAQTGTGTLVITATPFADVAVDGRARGTTPLSLELAPRLYRVTLTGPNGEVKTQNVEVVPGREAKVSHKWSQP